MTSPFLKPLFASAELKRRVLSLSSAKVINLLEKPSICIRQICSLDQQGHLWLHQVPEQNKGSHGAPSGSIVNLKSGGQTDFTFVKVGTHDLETAEQLPGR